MSRLSKSDTSEAMREELIERLAQAGLTDLADVDITDDNGVISLDRICSKIKGARNAEKALCILLSLVDECERAIKVIPHPLSSGVSVERLERWYVRHGFVSQKGSELQWYFRTARQNA